MAEGGEDASGEGDPNAEQGVAEASCLGSATVAESSSGPLELHSNAMQQEGSIPEDDSGSAAAGPSPPAMAQLHVVR